MPKIIYKHYLTKDWSLVVTRSLLEEISQVVSSAGWDFHGCDLQTIGGGTIDCATLDDLTQIPAHVLETVSTIKLTFRRPVPASEYAFVTLDNHSTFSDRPFSLSLSASDQGAALGLPNALVSFIKLRRQWYSFLSTAKPWFALICLPLVLIMAEGFIQMKTRQRVILPRLVDDGSYAVEAFGMLMFFVRLRLFPANDFNLLVPPAAQTSAARLRARAFSGLKFVGGAAILAVIASEVKRAVGF